MYVCVASGGLLPEGNVIPEFPSGSICPAGDCEHIWTLEWCTCMHTLWRTGWRCTRPALKHWGKANGQTWGKKGALWVDLTEWHPVKGNLCLKLIWSISQASWYQNTLYLVWRLLAQIYRAIPTKAENLIPASDVSAAPSDCHWGRVCIPSGCCQFGTVAFRPSA